MTEPLPTNHQVAALFVRRDSVYKAMPEVDPWDEDRDARKWRGGLPVVAHPPCQQWCALSHFARKDAEKKALAPLAVALVRSNGGVLEHPAHSKLWAAAGLPKVGARDAARGFTLPVDQRWWGHRARKRTFLYIVGCEPRDVPPVPFDMSEPEVTITTSRRRLGAKTNEMTDHTEREKTPPAFARWLVDLARKCA